MLNKAHIKLNAKRLYAADGHAVKVREKDTFRGRFQENFVLVIKVVEFWLCQAFGCVRTRSGPYCHGCASWIFAAHVA